MSLASPERLMWLLVALPIIGFYILKTRLRRRQVATLLFWDQVFEEKRQRSLWQNLRHWISLLLQLLVVGLLAGALADPLWRSQTNSGQELILVLDNSASMQAIDAESGRTRLETAVERASEVAAGLRQGDQIALITAGTSVRVVVGMTDFAPAIEEALQAIQVTDGPTQVTEAVEAARRLADDSQRRRIVVFSDMCFLDDDETAVADDLRWVQVGSSADNVAITTFQVRRSTVDPIGYALLIEVRNFSDQITEGRLKLELDQALVDVIPLSIEPNESWKTTIEGTSREGGVLTASVDVEDGLAIDNVARAIIPARPKIPVTLVAENLDESFYLRTVLESIPLLEITVAGEDWQPASGQDAASLTVLSGSTAKGLPPGPTLVVSPTADGPRSPSNDQGTAATASEPAWVLGPKIESPLIAKQNKESPLLRHVQLQNVLLNGGRDVEVSQSLGEPTTLLETAEGARVLVSVERSSGRILVLSADLNTSDLPLRIAFPVMMTNAVNWFFRESGDMRPALATGQITSVDWDVPEGDDGQAVLVDPDGQRRVVMVAEQQAALGPLQSVGVYGLFVPKSLPDVEAEQNDGVPSPRELINESNGVRGDLIAVNLSNAEESDLRLPELSPQAASDSPPGGAPAWLYLALLAIGLVVGEWALFNRRIVA